MSSSPQASFGDALRGLLDDLARLGRAEIGLVRAQGMRAGKHGVIALGLLLGAGLGLLLTLIFLLGAAAEEIGSVLGHPWAGWLCIAGLTLVVALVLGGLGYRMLRRAITEGKQVGTTVKEDLEWLSELPRQSASGS